MFNSYCLIFNCLITFITLQNVEGSVSFPKDFIFGVATSAYQIEGAWNESEKSESNWDYKTHFYPENVNDHSNGDIACDSYHQIDEDLKIIRELGVQSYRFSIAWTRILPDGFSNRVNEDGIRYYNKLIDGLLRYNITPSVTIYHWDHPQSLQEMGGWTNTLMIDLFADYARIAFEYFGDRVKHWITFNEPDLFCSDIKRGTVFSDGFGRYLCAYIMLKAHAKTYHIYKNEYYIKQKGKIGITYSSTWHEPKTNSTEDIAAAKRALEFELGLFANAIFSKDGDFPKIVKERVAFMSARQNFSKSRLPELTSEEIKTIHGTADFFGINHYTSDLVSDPSWESFEVSYDVDVHVDRGVDPSWPGSESGWLRDVPWGLHHLLVYIKDTYNNPIVYITENGFSQFELQDDGRVNYFKGYLESVANAIAEGCNVLGYYAWSLMDNFEWNAGYTHHFGLYHVNFSDPNRARTPRRSAFWYKDFITDQKS
ncbi:myrosinase 1-like [Chrysoperla carnea]|uniref:myrosinase 1-like n=1 Tax=Chrysoperla carnea TaxID=189513 RepID=UPI001D09631F|nr:myrosinase 1-like [Chrysoperla carnea]